MTETPTLPADLFVRSPTKADAQAIVDVVLADEFAEMGFTDTVVEDLLEIWVDHETDLAHDACVLTTTDGTIVAYAGVMITDKGFMLDPHTREHPDYQQRNLKPYLLQFIEERARAYLAQHPEHPRQVSTQCFSAAWIHFLSHAGYTQNNHYIRMELQLPEAPPEPRPMEGISIRHYQPGQDEAATHAVVQDAFQDIGKHPYQPFAEWLESITQRSGFDPNMLYVAVAEENIVGTVICQTYPEDHSCFIRQDAVARPWRKRGIALNLLYTVFGASYQRGLTRVSLDVDEHNATGAHQLYRRAGMRRVSESAILEKIL